MAGRHLAVALDTSCLIALLCDWHDRHPKTLRSYQRYLDRQTRIIIPVHAILECYSVLTRVPPPYRMSAQRAQQLIEGNFAASATIAGTKPNAIWDLLGFLARHNIGGGQVYDAFIAASAAEAGADVLLTWNLKHFALAASSSLEFREP